MTRSPQKPDNETTPAKLHFQTADQWQLSGEVSFFTVKAVANQGIAQLKSLVGKSVVVDLSQVARCDSAALALLLCWLRESLAGQIKLYFTHLPQQLLALARLANLESLIVQVYE